MSKATTTTTTTTTSTKSEVMNVEQQVLNDEPVVVSKSKINKYHKLDWYDPETMVYWHGEIVSLLEKEKEAKNPRGKIRDEMNILLKDIKEDKLLFDAISSIKKTYQKYKDKMKKMLSIHVDEAAVKDLLSRREDKLKKLAKLKDQLNNVRKGEKQNVKLLKKRRKAIQ